MNNAKLLLVIDPNPVEKQALACICQELRAQFTGGKVNIWELYHITLQYFEEMPENRIADIKQAMKKACRGQRSFTMVTGQPGTTGPADCARVWIGITEGKDTLADLHARLDKQLTNAGFEVSPDPYNPHITLGRDLDTTKFNPPISETLLASVNLSGGALTLLESRYEGDRKVYEPLAVCKFRP